MTTTPMVITGEWIANRARELQSQGQDGAHYLAKAIPSLNRSQITAILDGAADIVGDSVNGIDVRFLGQDGGR